MKITIKEIAEKAHVSIGTVDRALHNRGKVNKDTRERIKQICDEYGYESNIVGKAMAMQKRQRIIAVIINSRDRNLFSAIIHDGIEKVAKEVADYNVVYEFHDIYENIASKTAEILDELFEREIDGIIIKPVDNPTIKAKLQRFADEKKVPIVTCTSNIDGVDKICYVGQNHHKLGRLFANTMCKLSSEEMRIIVIAGPLADKARREKLDGFLEYMKESGRAYRICDICEVPFDDDITHDRTLDILKKYPEANAFWMHASSLAPCMNALRDYGKFVGVKGAFGHESYTAAYVEDRQLDYAIYEKPFEHGYMAGKIMFDYLLNGVAPEGGNCVFDGQIAFEENCRKEK